MYVCMYVRVYVRVYARVYVCLTFHCVRIWGLHACYRICFISVAIFLHFGISFAFDSEIG